MGHREDLLAGAKRCLYERGYARTTARDIVAASGTNLASIGYHFRSKEALLNAAMTEAIEEWGEEFRRDLAATIDPTATPIERFESIWTGMIAAFDTHQPLWIATFEALAQAQHSPELRSFLADSLQEGRLGLAALFQNSDAADQKRAQAVGSLYQALMSGLIVQWVIDPERAPSGHDLAEALRTILGNTQPGVVADDIQD
ncbi:MAG: TetR/AcrR family transcriptional regulator [Roseiflexaceae bacterium]